MEEMGGAQNTCMMTLHLLNDKTGCKGEMQPTQTAVMLKNSVMTCEH